MIIVIPPSAPAAATVSRFKALRREWAATYKCAVELADEVRGCPIDEAPEELLLEEMAKFTQAIERFSAARAA